MCVRHTRSADNKKTLWSKSKKLIRPPPPKSCPTTQMPNMFADDSFYPRVMRWGQNHEDDWWQPITTSQFAEYGFETAKIGDRATFWLNDDSYEVVIVGMVDKKGYQELAKVYGEFQMRDWQIDHLIRMRTI